MTTYTERRWKEINQTFHVIEQFTRSIAKGDMRFLIISGAPGLGKSFGTYRVMNELDRNSTRHCIMKGYASGPALYRKLYDHKGRGQVVILDDIDDVFKDEKGMNILKAATDTLPKRVISYEVEKEKDLPRNFVFEGSIILITNYDFDAWMLAAGKKKIVNHFRALLDRGHYINIGINESDPNYADDCIIRIMQVMQEGFLSHLREDEKMAVLTYMQNHKDKLRTLSLRMAEKLAGELKLWGKDRWEQMVPVTCWAK